MRLFAWPRSWARTWWNWTCASAYGVPVAIHVPSVDRTISGTGLVRDLTLAELQRLDACDGERIPTLGEAIESRRVAGGGPLP